jgi:hypothetical protein
MNSDQSINQVPPAQPIQQPTQQTSEQPVIPQKTIDTNPEPQQQQEPQTIQEKLETPLVDRLITKYGHWVHKIVVWALMFQGLKGLYGSGVFILVEIPAKELALQNGLIVQEEINTLASKTILMMFSAFLSMIFALRLRALKSDTAKKINTAVGVFLFFANNELIQFLNSQGSSEFISAIMLKFFTSN